jgi:transposase
VAELIPEAQVVADRFHVMVQINKELDTERKREKQRHQKKNLNRSKYYQD